MDVWFDSGSSWAGVVSATPGLRYPADLYLEGSDQHRGALPAQGRAVCCGGLLWRAAVAAWLWLPAVAACCGCLPWRAAGPSSPTSSAAGAASRWSTGAAEPLLLPCCPAPPRRAGWFQSSLLTSVAAKGAAPYKQVCALRVCGGGVCVCVCVGGGGGCRGEARCWHSLAELQRLPAAHSTSSQPASCLPPGKRQHPETPGAHAAPRTRPARHRACLPACLPAPGADARLCAGREGHQDEQVCGQRGGPEVGGVGTLALGWLELGWGWAWLAGLAGWGCGLGWRGLWPGALQAPPAWQLL